MGSILDVKHLSRSSSFEVTIPGGIIRMETTRDQVVFLRHNYLPRVITPRTAGMGRRGGELPRHPSHQSIFLLSIVRRASWQYPQCSPLNIVPASSSPRSCQFSHAMVTSAASPRSSPWYGGDGRRSRGLASESLN